MIDNAPMIIHHPNIKNGMTITPMIDTIKKHNKFNIETI